MRLQFLFAYGKHHLLLLPYTTINSLPACKHNLTWLISDEVFEVKINLTGTIAQIVSLIEKFLVISDHQKLKNTGAWDNILHVPDGYKF